MPFSTFQLYIAVASGRINDFLVFRTTFCQSHRMLSHITVVEEIDRGKKRMNPIVLTIINTLKEISQARDQTNPSKEKKQVHCMQKLCP